ncbi:family 78 glycoside hydrolase catalytic domain [Candidatus Pristimantibacillus sp. PTI5]|uniref:family 78 glycoside hydrolase catalytic domain n=1 Tax=Candidatus Pristimantibacillus sp. PTI5 TaxID=3400422 RepID=UPI003B011209
MVYRSSKPSLRFMSIFLVLTMFLSSITIYKGASQASASEGSSVGVGTQIKDLKVEYRTNPIGVDTIPRFSWIMTSDVRGQKQTAYQLLVATSPDKLTPESADVWNSGKVASDKSVAVEYAGNAFAATTLYYWTVKVWDKNGTEVATPEANYFETGVLSTDGVGGWSGAKWISIDTTQRSGAPFLRKETSLDGEVASARLYITALGVFDAYINGDRVGIVGDSDTSYELLAPGWTEYNKEINYMSYDVTSYVQGENSVTLAALLGNGWYNSRIAQGAPYYSSQGQDLALLAKMLITYEDGSTEVIVTDTNAGWKGTVNTPYTLNDIYDGENYDATKEIVGWNDNGFNDAEWLGVKENNFKTTRYSNAKVTSYNGRTAQIIDSLDQTPIAVTTSVYGAINTESSRNGKGEINVDLSRTVTDAAAAKEYDATLSTGDTVIYDLAQNMVGVPNITVKGEAGTQIRLRFSEMLNDDSNGADGPKGSLYLANLRGAQATARYTLKGSEEGENYQSSLSFFGFRYVEVTVVTQNKSVQVLDVTGKVATSAIDVTGTVETSDQNVNQLISNIQWGQRGNYLWIPTDCPQRNERAGWMGDIQLFAKTGFYNVDTANFLENFTYSMMNAQRDNGAFPVTVPITRYAGSQAPHSGWSDAGVIVPWTHWQFTGDTRVIEKAYPSLVKYMDRLFELTGTNYRGPGGQYGDWLSFQRRNVNGISGANHLLVSDAYYAYDAQIMAQIAGALGKTEDVAKYEALFENIKQAFINNHIRLDDEGKLTLLHGGNGNDPGENNAQTSLLWALKLGMYANEDQKQQMIELLVSNIRNDDAFKAANPTSARVNYAENTLSVGFLGVNVLAPVLTEAGHSDLAYTLLLQDEMPSWLYSVKNGATTIWERWNSYSVEDGFGPASMNSFNHFSYGAIGEWMYNNMLGISNDLNNPGFKHTILQPSFDGLNRITWAKGSYDSVYGTISSGWNVDGNSLTYEATVPANTTATLYLPAASANFVTEGGLPAAQAEGIQFVGYENGKAVYELESGSYHFVSSIALEDGVVWTGPAAVSSNQQFELTYGLVTDVENITAQDITITYDAEKLELLAPPTSADETVFAIAGYEHEPGTIRIVGAHLNGGLERTDAGLVKLNFKAKNAVSGIAAVSVTNLIAADSQGNEIEITGRTHNVVINVIGRAALLELIGNVQSFHDAAVEGKLMGQYPAGFKAVLQMAINNAKAVVEDAQSTQTQLEQAATVLQAAWDSFKALVIVSIPGDMNTDDKVSIGDLGIMAKAYGKSSSDADWNQVKQLDLNKDNKIDISDLVSLALLILNW